MHSHFVSSLLRQRVVALVVALGVALAAAPAVAEGRLLSLDEALRTARAHQPQLQVARAQARVASARVGEAQAGYLPRVDAQAQYQRSTPNFLLSPMMVHTPLTKGYQANNLLGPGDTVNYYVFGVTATQLLYDFGRASSAVSQARAGVDASQADARAASHTVALNVRLAYYSALAAQQLVQVGEETVRNQQAHVGQIRRFVDGGQRTRFDLSSMELNLANAELALARARNALALAKVRLITAMGTDGQADFEIAEPASQGPDLERTPAEVLARSAEQRRPELARIDAQLRAQKSAARGVRAGYLPTLTAVGNVSGAKVQGFDAGYDWYLGVGLNWNLFGGMLTTRQSEEADAGIDVAAAQRESARQAMRAEIQEQLLGIADAQQRQLVSERAVSTATERLHQAEDRFQTGAGDALDLDDAQVSVANAKAQRVQARYDLAMSRARLRWAVGEDQP